eukprot:s976_g15.t2
METLLSKEGFPGEKPRCGPWPPGMTAAEPEAENKADEKADVEAEVVESKATEPKVVEAPEEEDNVSAVLKLMSGGHFEAARKELMKMLKENPNDAVVLHNLGVALTEEGRYQEAEEKFLQAWELQKKANKVNYATMFGLATVLTEQGESGKLLQAEALFHDFLEKAISQEEKGIAETYRGFLGLADNLERQKRWMEASHAWQQAVEMATPMQTSKVGHLREGAEVFAGQPFLRLVTAEGHILADPEEELQAAGLRDGDTITAVRAEPKVAATAAAFVFWCPGYDGTELRAWGHPELGGDSSTVQDQLRNVKQVQAAHSAFAAILANGSVVTWGHQECGGDSSEVQEQLRNVQKVQAAQSAFAAILENGSVVTWGHPEWGGDSSGVQEQLSNVEHIQASAYAFAAILANGSVITWGDPAAGGDSSLIQEQLRNVKQIQATRSAFAAILANGSVVTWGRPACGGDSSEVQEQLRNVQQVQATQSAFAAILENGSVVTWGHPEWGGDSSGVQEQLSDVEHIQASAYAFAAILANGSVVTWGDPASGGDSSLIQEQLRNVKEVQAAKEAFAAILRDGSVISWGFGKVLSRGPLSNVQQVQATDRAFVAIRPQGELLPWGDVASGGKEGFTGPKMHKRTPSWFGASHERTFSHQLRLKRAERLSRWQRNMRMGIWALTLAVPLGFGWTWYRSAEQTAFGQAFGVIASSFGFGINSSQPVTAEL